MAFREDLKLIERMRAALLAKRNDPADMMATMSLRKALLDLVHKYRYAARDAIDALTELGGDGVTAAALTKLGGDTTAAALTKLGGAALTELGSTAADIDKLVSQHMKRAVTVAHLLLVIESRGLASVPYLSADLSHVLHELAAQYESRIRPLAQLALRAIPTMRYDRDFHYRSLTYDPNVSGPIVGVEGLLTDIYRPWSVFQWQDKSDGVLAPWRPLPSRDDEDTLQHRRTATTNYYNQGLFFGHTTRSTQIVAFSLLTRGGGCGPSRGVDETDGYVVERADKCAIFSAPLAYDADTGELCHAPAGRMDSDVNHFQLVCEEVASDRSKTKVSLAASLRLHQSKHGVQVAKIGWIDATELDNDKLLYAAVSGDGGDVLWRRAGFPYSFVNCYRTWHVVMGNGCRIKVRVTRMYEIVADAPHQYRVPQDGSCKRWTLANTDQHPHFDECAAMLQKYYGFQACVGNTKPLDCVTVNAFALAHKNRVANLHWLIDARLDRPSAEGTRPASLANRKTSQLLQTMVLKSLAELTGADLEYLRFDCVSTE